MLISAFACTHRGAVAGSGLKVIADYPGGDPVACVVRVGAAGEDGCDYPSVRVDCGAARVAWPHVDTEAGNDALHGATVVGVARDDALRRPRAGRFDIERTVLGVTDHGGRVAWPWRRKTPRGQVETVHAQDRYVVLLVEDDYLGGQEASGPPDLYSCSRLSGDNVGVGDDQILASDPARPFHAVAAGYTRYPQRAG